MTEGLPPSYGGTPPASEPRPAPASQAAPTWTRAMALALVIGVWALFAATVAVAIPAWMTAQNTAEMCESITGGFLGDSCFPD